MDLGLRNKRVIITGGSAGIGKAAATTLYSEGAKVAIVARGQDTLDATVAEIKGNGGGEIVGIAADVRNETSVQQMVETVVKAWGGVDALANNAGTSSASPFEEMTSEQVLEDFNLKVMGAINCTRHALPWLKKSGSGVIINTTTPGGKAPGPGTQPTALSRAAGISLTKAWSKEFAQYGIRVNTICVGTLKSRQHELRWQAANAKDPNYTLDNHWAKLSTNIPLGRVGEAREAGDVIAFLCSERASYISGAALNVDGGVAPVT